MNFKLRREIEKRYNREGKGRETEMVMETDMVSETEISEGIWKYNDIFPCGNRRAMQIFRLADIFNLFAQSRQSAMRFSSRRNWDSPTPLAAGECAPPPPPFGPLGGHTRLRLKGWGNPNSNEGTYTVVLYCIYISTLCLFGTLILHVH